MSITKQDITNEINELSNSKLKPISIPVNVLLHEGAELLIWSLEDKEHLLRCGLHTDSFTKLEMLISLTREGELAWKTQRKKGNENKTEWNIKKGVYKQLHKDTIRKFKYAFRNDKNALDYLVELNKKYIYADVIIGLSHLSVLASSKQEELKQANINPDIVYDLDTASGEASYLFAQSKINHELQTLKRTRDQYYTLLFDLMSNVRNCGKYAFCNNKERIKGYYSEFTCEKNAKFRKK